MNPRIEKKIILYTSILIAMVVNLPKLLALRTDGLIAKFWPFNPYELIFQSVHNYLFCLVLGFLLIRIPENLKKDSGLLNYLKQIGIVLLILPIITLPAILIQLQVYEHQATDLIFVGGYFIRIGISTFLMIVALRIISLIMEIKKNESENELLRNAYLNAQLELLKEQLNPHFFFNSLSSLSAIVRENPPLAQHYISQLSKVYRYALQNVANNLVSLEEELLIFHSYTELLKMRHEKGFNVVVEVEENYLNLLLPHMSLQPLIENAVKHNIASVSKPLIVKISIHNNKLIFSNNLQKIEFPEHSTGTGLSNLNERYKILKHKEIDIIQTDKEFIIQLPLD